MPLSYPSPFLAAPYGLEVQFTYNNLTLNANKTNNAAAVAAGGIYYIDSIGGFDDADIRFSSEEFSDFDGENPLLTFYNGRTVTLEGRIWGANFYQMRVLEQNLRTAFGLNLRTEKALTMSTGIAANDVFLMCRKSAPLSMRDTKQSPSQHTVRAFQISLRASDPRFLSSTGVTVQSATNPANLANLACTNSGNYLSYPVITVHGPFNTALTLTNTTTSDLIKFDAPLTSGNTLVLDTKLRTVKDSQNSNANAYSFLDPSTTWLTLSPGAQNIQLSGVAGGSAASQVTVTYNHAWM